MLAFAHRGIEGVFSGKSAHPRKPAFKRRAIDRFQLITTGFTKDLHPAEEPGSAQIFASFSRESRDPLQARWHSPGRNRDPGQPF